jgi:phosphomannomutase
MKRYIFDIDGTLTPPRKQMDEAFKAWFVDWAKDKQVYLVTGSDRPKTEEQMGKDIYDVVACVYNCSGNEVWKGVDRLHESTWTLPAGAQKWLQGQLAMSKFGLRTGNHFEQRSGMLNFSVVGRNANNEERYFYWEWDEATGERERIAREFNETFPALQARIGGQTGIDISPMDADKSQIVKDFPEEDQLHFFGDDMREAGNDFPLAKVILDNQRGCCYSVRDWKDTWNYLQTL